MPGVSNHNVNAWEQTGFKAFSEALPAFMALSAVGEGMLMIYNGQEAGNKKPRAFFERDPIVWREHENGVLYQKLFALKKANSALWNAGWGARMIPVFNSKPNQVLSFVRQNDNNKVFAVFNLSKEPLQVSFKDKLQHGQYQDFHTGKAVAVSADTRLDLAPWSYQILSQQH